MNVQINQLVKSLLQKDSLDQCSVQELQQFADRHPYFGAAQLLLTKKLQTENSDQYNEQLQKTFLFFHNPLWVEQLLNETRQPVIFTETPGATDDIAVPGLAETENPEPDKIPPEVEISESVPAESHQEVQIIDAKPAETGQEEFAFEPYYTVDYFASQGIQFKEEELPKDKFGQQLKSFTEWLRSMKKLPLSEIKSAGEPVAEQKVLQLAEHSIEEGEVITEAMAEVWQKQGNEEKAIGILSKLSLLDPSKSVYFAAKIEELKKRI